MISGNSERHREGQARRSDDDLHHGQGAGGRSWVGHRGGRSRERPISDALEKNASCGHRGSDTAEEEGHERDEAGDDEHGDGQPDAGRNGCDADQQAAVDDEQPPQPGTLEPDGGGADDGRSAAEDHGDEVGERTDEQLGCRSRRR